MKNYFFLAFFLVSLQSVCQIAYPQDLIYHTRDEAASYIDQNGNKKYEEVSNINGNFEINITKAAEVKNSPIINIFGDKYERGYYAFVGVLDNIKIGQKLYEANFFYSTALKTGVYIYLAFDKSSLIITTKSNRVITYY